MVLISSLLLSGPLIYKTESAIAPIFVTPAAEVYADPEDPGATPIPLPNWDKKERINILLVGVDKREDDEYSRTDTIILVTIDPLAKTVGLMSFPRDLRVNIYQYGEHKINAAYIFGEVDKRPGGGVGLLRRTIARNFGVPIHYYAQVDFRGFERIVDEFGGVNVDVPYPLKDDEYPTETYGYTGIYFAAGLQHLDGKTALRYARTRHADNDFGRARRQQEVILSLRQQALSLDLIKKFYPLLEILGGSVKTDLKPEQVAALAQLGQGIPRENIKGYSLEGLLSGYEEGGDSFLIADWPAVKARMRQMIPNLALLSTTLAPDPAVKIGVQNGTYRPQFAAQTVERLKGAGFAGASVDATEVTESPKPMPFSIVYDYTGSGEMALLVVKRLGLPEDAVRPGPGPAPGEVEILVVLGEDVPYVEPRPSPAPAPSPMRQRP